MERRNEEEKKIRVSIKIRKRNTKQTRKKNNMCRMEKEEVTKKKKETDKKSEKGKRRREDQCVKKKIGKGMANRKRKISQQMEN